MFDYVCSPLGFRISRQLSEIPIHQTGASSNIFGDLGKQPSRILNGISLASEVHKGPLAIRLRDAIRDPAKVGMKSANTYLNM